MYALTGWWDRQESDPHPSSYELPALPLSYYPIKQINALLVYLKDLAQPSVFVLPHSARRRTRLSLWFGVEPNIPSSDS